jgi:hypothetical protein
MHTLPVTCNSGMAAVVSVSRKRCQTGFHILDLRMKGWRGFWGCRFPVMRTRDASFVTCRQEGLGHLGSEPEVEHPPQGLLSCYA